MKISSPRINTQLENTTLEELIDGDLEDVILQDIDATNCFVQSLNMISVRLDKVILTAAQLERIGARDLSAKQTDFSATHMVNGAINRAEFNNCRMTGVDFSRTALHDVTFRDCKLDMANFRFGDLRRVQFVDCTFVESDFLNATLHDVMFESCVLERTVFDQVKCKMVDLRRSQLSEISGWTSLKGAMIDTVQLMSVAPYLANELGIVVREG